MVIPPKENPDPLNALIQEEGNRRLFAAAVEFIESAQFVLKTVASEQYSGSMKVSPGGTTFTITGAFPSTDPQEIVKAMFKQQDDEIGSLIKEFGEAKLAAAVVPTKFVSGAVAEISALARSKGMPAFARILQNNLRNVATGAARVN